MPDHAEIIDGIMAELEDTRRAYKHDKQAYKAIIRLAIHALEHESQKKALEILRKAHADD